MPDDKKPAVIAQEFANTVGVSKVKLPTMTVVLLGLLAGAYIAFGGLLSSAVTFDLAPFTGVGVKKLVGSGV